MTNYTKTKETLDNLYNDLKEQYKLALEDARLYRYESASEKLSLAQGKADRELLVASKELSLPFSGLDQEKKTRGEVETVYNKINIFMDKIKAQKKICDQNHSTNEVIEELEEAQVRIKALNERRAIAQQYERSFAQLSALKKQKEPLAGVEDELNSFLKKVKELRMDNSVSVTDLTAAMNVAYDRLTGGSKEKFDTFTENMHAQDSLPLKILGATLLILGAALVVSAILFAPAVITAATTGLATIYLATAGVAAASSALSIGGSACFFSKTNRMELAEIEQDLGDRNLEDHHYNHVAPVA